MPKVTKVNQLGCFGVAGRESSLILANGGSALTLLFPFFPFLPPLVFFPPPGTI